MRKTIAVFLLSVAALLSSDSADGGNWPHWRGANHDGLVTGKGFPTTWAEDENIAWKVKLPGWGTSTPIIIEEAGQEILVVLGADHVTAHEATTGKEVWRVGGLNPTQQGNFRSIASPVSVAGAIIAPYARGRTLTAIRSAGKGDVTKSHVGWTIDGASSDVPSPVAYKGRVYICGDRGEIACVDVKTGKNLWTERLPRNRYPYSASPIIAEGRLYATREDGTTFVLELGDTPKLIATNTLRENTYATPAFADGQIYLRSSGFLFCLGEK